jgi:site-specific DNA-methyltransferase (adenine-specific)
VKIKNGEFWLGDCLELMRAIPDGSVDMILCDLPYGTTQNKWGSVIPFEPLWEQYWRVCKPNAAVVLTAQCPFDKVLGVSQLQYLKYEWIW